VTHRHYYSLVLRLTEAESLAAEGGLWRTYHAINKAKRELGYERAVQLDREGRKIHEQARSSLEKHR